MIDLSWLKYDDADADSYKVYRAVPGFIIPFPNSLATGDQFIFSATSADIQTITLGSVSIANVAAQLATAKGLEISTNQAGTAIFVRLLATREPRLKLYSCSALTSLGMPPQTIVPELNFVQIASVPIVNTTTEYSYSDADGSPLDSYRITSATGSSESIPSVVVSPVLPGYDFCAIETRFIDVVGRPVVGVEVIAEVATPFCDSTVRQKVTVKSDTFGRINFPLMQGQQYVLHIPAIGYNEYVTVPAQAAVNLADLTITLQPQFSPFGDPA